MKSGSTKWNNTFKVISILLGLIIAVILGEIIARAVGNQPYKEEVYEVNIEPEGNLFEPDSLLGFQIKPGKYTLTLPSGFNFSITHDKDGHRISRPLDAWIEEDFEKEVWVFGCSYTHGWSVNDHETYTWNLQEQFPKIEFVNFAQPAYSNVHSLLQLKQALKNQSPPDLVILAYASFHDERNVSSRKWHKTLAPFNKLGPLKHPFATVKNDRLLIAYQDLEYQPYALSRKLALMHMIEQYAIRREMKSLRSDEVTRKVIEEIYDVCLENKIDFLLASIVNDQEAIHQLQMAKDKGMEVIDFSVDTRIKENTNLPDDSHPSAYAHRQYAEKITDYLRGWLNE